MSEMKNYKGISFLEICYKVGTIITYPLKNYSVHQRHYRIVHTVYTTKKKTC